MEQQRIIINDIKSQITSLKTTEKELEEQLAKQVKILVTLCETKGHQFDRHGGWDGHQNFYYYVCSVCQHGTSSKPDKWRKDYSN